MSGEPVAMHTGFYPRAPDAGVWGPPPKGLSKQTAWGVHSPHIIRLGNQAFAEWVESKRSPCQKCACGELTLRWQVK